ncbi:hypothetical protein BLNAU_10247 [Blattamonas nauphoetae]|uniref:DDE-1 domain-containing protein n=1 Tax=Blattamonas nauphoetae TaxID=2049346 RepID=A0ABQ9XTG2_9EUKA|nr:hypothetical protein BLNAU_10247 [Blattamonas nauphoetae]
MIVLSTCKHSSSSPEERPRSNIPSCHLLDGCPILRKLYQLTSTHHYHKDLIIQADETSLQNRSFRPGKVIGQTTRQRCYTVRTKPMTKMTSLFVVGASGKRYRSHLIFHNDYPLPILKDHKEEWLTMRTSPKGWMTSTIFEDIVKNSIMKEIEDCRKMHLQQKGNERKEIRRRATETTRKRKKTSESEIRESPDIDNREDESTDATQAQPERALLIIDGHSSRHNLDLMDWLAERGVDVIILPSHSSEFLQPLDQLPNKKWKEGLCGVTFPSRRKDERGRDHFLDRVFAAIDSAMNSECIRNGFKMAGLILASPSKMLAKLMHEHSNPTSIAQELDNMENPDSEWETGRWRHKILEDGTMEELLAGPIESTETIGDVSATGLFPSADTSSQIPSLGTDGGITSKAKY